MIIKSRIKLETEFTDVTTGMWLIVTRVKEDLFIHTLRIYKHVRAQLSVTTRVCNRVAADRRAIQTAFNPLKPELNPTCYLLALLGARHFLHVSRIRVKSLTLRRLMSYIYIWSTHS